MLRDENNCDPFPCLCCWFGTMCIIFFPHILHIIIDQQVSRKSVAILDQYRTVNIPMVALAVILQIPVVHILFFLILLYVYI